MGGFISRWNVRVGMAACLLAVLLALSATVTGCSVSSQGYVVTATPSPSPEPRVVTVTVCASDCDASSIQDAIDSPDTLSGTVIRIVDPVHTEADIVVNKHVIIEGQGADITVVQAHAVEGEATGRVFYIVSGAEVTIRDMTIRHGNPDLEPYYLGVRRNGGAIANQGNLTLENCVIRDNMANGGAGILNRGELTVRRCTITENYADGIDEPGQECGSGAAIRTTQGTVSVLDSTLSNNEGEGRGGALHIACASKLVATNTTISGNSARFRGGAAHVQGALELINCTVYGNSAAGIGRYGTVDPEPAGGIYVGGVFNYNQTIIAGSNRGDCVVAEDGQIEAGNDNLVEDGSCSPALSGDPLLDALAGNGDDIWSHALLPGSPAIDAVENELCPVSTDQRGEPRPQGGGCDIGAFEVQVQ